MRLSEVSPNTLDGSFSDDLVLSKIWLIKQVSRVRSNFGTIYVLGSWFGNLGLLMASKSLDFDRIINVDLDSDAIDVSELLVSRLGLSDRIEHMSKDANELDYRQLGHDGLVVNTSCNNMAGSSWFDAIPRNTLIALQGRNNDPGAELQQSSTEDLIKAFPMRKVLFTGKITLEDDDGTYDRYMIIGEK